MLRKKSTFQQRYKRNQKALVLFFLAGVSRTLMSLSRVTVIRVHLGKPSVYQYKGMYQLNWMAIQGHQKSSTP